MVIGCAYAGFPVVGPVDQALSGLMVRESPTARGFQAVQTVTSALDQEIVSISLAGLTARAWASLTMLMRLTFRSRRSIYSSGSNISMISR